MVGLSMLGGGQRDESGQEKWHQPRRSLLTCCCFHTDSMSVSLCESSELGEDGPLLLSLGTR